MTTTYMYYMFPIASVDVAAINMRHFNIKFSPTNFELSVTVSNGCISDIFLAHCGLMTPFGNIETGQYYVR